MKYLNLLICAFILISSTTILPIDDELNQNFLLAIRNNNREGAQALLDLGVSVNYLDKLFNTTALSITASDCNHDMIQWLLDNGADLKLKPNGKQLPINIALENCNDPAIIKALMPQPNSYTKEELSNILHKAITEHFFVGLQIPIIDALLQAGASLDNIEQEITKIYQDQILNNEFVIGLPGENTLNKSDILKKRKKQILAAFNLQKISEHQEDICPICQEELNSNTELQKAVCQKHEFHRECLDSYIASEIGTKDNPTGCPLCRHKL